MAIGIVNFQSSAKDRCTGKGLGFSPPETDSGRADFSLLGNATLIRSGRCSATYGQALFYILGPLDYLHARKIPENPISLNSGIYLKSYQGSYYNLRYIP